MGTRISLSEVTLVTTATCVTASQRRLLSVPSLRRSFPWRFANPRTRASKTHNARLLQIFFVEFGHSIRDNGFAAKTAVSLTTEPSTQLLKQLPGLSDEASGPSVAGEEFWSVEPEFCFTKLTKHHDPGHDVNLNTQTLCSEPDPQKRRGFLILKKSFDQNRRDKTPNQIRSERGRASPTASSFTVIRNYCYWENIPLFFFYLFWRYTVEQ